MRVYLDSSALIKRVIAEPESSALIEEIDQYHAVGALLVSSSLGWIEVARALRNRLNASFADVADDVDDAMSGVAEHPVEIEVVSLSRRLDPNLLRSLDAIHLASAVVLDVDVLVTYDERLAAASRQNGLKVSMPGRA